MIIRQNNRYFIPYWLPLSFSSELRRDANSHTEGAYQEASRTSSTPEGALKEGSPRFKSTDAIAIALYS